MGESREFPGDSPGISDVDCHDTFSARRGGPLPQLGKTRDFLARGFARGGLPPQTWARIGCRRGKSRLCENRRSMIKPSGTSRKPGSARLRSFACSAPWRDEWTPISLPSSSPSFSSWTCHKRNTSNSSSPHCSTSDASSGYDSNSLRGNPEIGRAHV